MAGKGTALHKRHRIYVDVVSAAMPFIEAMIARALVPHDLLIERFKRAVEYFEMDARAEELPKYVSAAG